MNSYMFSPETMISLYDDIKKLLLENNKQDKNEYELGERFGEIFIEILIELQRSDVSFNLEKIKEGFKKNL
jgi:stress response protein SCP2